MDKSKLQARAERRRKWAQDGTAGSLAEEIALVWMQIASNWDPSREEKVPEEVPVGPEFKAWVDSYLKNSRFRWREFDGASDLAAKEIANVIDHAGNRLVGRDFPNPIDGVNKEKGESYVIKSASTRKADTVYGPVRYPDRHRNQYEAPFEWTRHSPENPGIMLQRIGDGIYQDPVSGKTYEYEKGVYNQTNLGWNDTWPQPGFLTHNQQSWEDKELESYGKPKPVSKKAAIDESLLGEASSEDLKNWVAGKSNGFTKRAIELQIESNVFGPPQEKTRYCPDHAGVMMYRVSDDIYQCPLDRKVYDFAQGFTTQDGREFHGGSVAEMTPDRPDYYQSPHPFLQVGSFKSFTKQGGGLERKRGEQSLQRKREDQVSGLRPYQERATLWLNMPLDEAKAEFKAIVSDVFAGDPKSLSEAIKGIEGARNTERLMQHFFNLLLKHEGYEVIRGSKEAAWSPESFNKGFSKEAYANLESRFVFDLSHALTNDSDSSKRVLQLVIEGVMKRGKPLGEAIRDAYTVIDQEEVVPSAPAGPVIDVSEEPEIPQA